MSQFSRRDFLRHVAAGTALVVVPVPAFILPRDPYVVVGEVVSFVGLGLHPEPTFIGGHLVREIGKWDGTGYPVTLFGNAVGPHNEDVTGFYDFDLANFNREVPAHFWHSATNQMRYPNLHAYVREMRFGEDPSVSWARLERARNL